MNIVKLVIVGLTAIWPRNLVDVFSWVQEINNVSILKHINNKSIDNFTAGLLTLKGDPN
jgi:hypothetical protein